MKDALLRVGEWKSNVKKLYADIRDWVGPDTFVREETIALNEERSGRYEISKLILARGDKKTSVEPVATWVVGADGRVKIKTMDGSYTLLFFKERTGGIWKYWDRDKIPPLKLLTKELFLYLIEDFMND